MLKTKWKTETPQAPPCVVLSLGKVRLSIYDQPDAKLRRWQFFSMSFGANSDGEREDCMQSWPREALRMAREELAKFEAKLEEK